MSFKMAYISFFRKKTVYTTLLKFQKEKGAYSSSFTRYGSSVRSKKY